MNFVLYVGAQKDRARVAYYFRSYILTIIGRRAAGLSVHGWAKLTWQALAHSSDRGLGVAQLGSFQ
jgi:hypothetical protein